MLHYLNFRISRIIKKKGPLVYKLHIGACLLLMQKWRVVVLVLQQPVRSVNQSSLFTELKGQFLLTSTPCPNCVILGLRACHENNKSLFESINNFKTGSPFIIVAKLFFTLKNLNFVNDEVRAGFPKLGHSTLLILILILILQY